MNLKSKVLDALKSVSWPLSLPEISKRAGHENAASISCAIRRLCTDGHKIEKSQSKGKVVFYKLVERE